MGRPKLSQAATAPPPGDAVAARRRNCSELRRRAGLARLPGAAWAVLRRIGFRSGITGERPVMAQPRWVPGRSWHYMVFCSRCGARPALPKRGGREHRAAGPGVGPPAGRSPTPSPQSCPMMRATRRKDIRCSTRTPSPRSPDRRRHRAETRRRPHRPRPGSRPAERPGSPFPATRTLLAGPGKLPPERLNCRQRRFTRQGAAECQRPRRRRLPSRQPS